MTRARHEVFIDMFMLLQSNDQILFKEGYKHSFPACMRSAAPTSSTCARHTSCPWLVLGHSNGTDLRYDFTANYNQPVIRTHQCMALRTPGEDDQRGYSCHGRSGPRPSDS